MPLLTYKPSVIYLLHRSPHGSSILPSIALISSDGTPSNDGIHELAASRWHSPMITHRLVVSYTTFSPLPRTSVAVVFFCRHLPSPTASILGSGVPCAARTFLSHDNTWQRQNRDSVSNGVQSYALFVKNKNKLPFIFMYVTLKRKVKNTRCISNSR